MKRLSLIKLSLAITIVAAVGWCLLSMSTRTEYFKGGPDDFYDSYLYEWPVFGKFGQRTYSFKDGSFMSGTVTRSGKWHGRCLISSSSVSQWVWYWYGEEVTEGVFELRNK